MQDRYAGDIGDYIKLALLRAITARRTLGIAWYLYPDETHNDDGRHTSYLEQPARWRNLDDALFDTLKSVVATGRSVAALQKSNVLAAAHADEKLDTRALAPANRLAWRSQWFQRVLTTLENCDLVFADPDNGLVDDRPDRRTKRKFGKQLPLEEALALSSNRTAVIYHHNSRFTGGHAAEISHWQRLLGRKTVAVRANAFSCRTFFIVNPDDEIRDRVAAFCDLWSQHRVGFVDA